MLLTMEKLWSKFQEFMGRIDKLESDSAKAKQDVKHVENKVELLEKGQAHTDKVVGYLFRADAEKDTRIKKLESEKRSEAIKAGIWKAKAAKLKDGRKPRH